MQNSIYKHFSDRNHASIDFELQELLLQAKFPDKKLYYWLLNNFYRIWKRTTVDQRIF